MFDEILKVSSNATCELPKNRIENYGAKCLTDNELLSVILGKSVTKNYHSADINIYSATENELIANRMTKLEAIKTLAITYSFKERGSI